MRDEPEFPGQTEAVHMILEYLLDKEVLSDDPSTVEMTREGDPSVFPCRRGDPRLDTSQINWALEKGKWWFAGPIKQLKITKAKKAKLPRADIKLLERIAEKAKFNLSID